MKIPDSQIIQIRNSANIIQIIGSHVKLKKQGNNYVGLCPFHQEKTASFSVSPGKNIYHCFGCGEGGDVFSFLMKHQGLTFIDAVKQVAERAGISIDSSRSQKSNSSNKPEAVFDYVDQSGTLIYQVVRFPGKKFLQRQPGKNGKWIWNLSGIEPVLYGLPDIIEAVKNKSVVFVVDGEKDKESVIKLGFAATCNSGGGGKWHKRYNKCLSGTNIVILRDNDDPGFYHAHEIAASTSHDVIGARILTLPGLPPKGDVTDWINVGGTAEELKKLVNKCKTWTTADIPADINKPEYIKILQKKHRDKTKTTDTDKPSATDQEFVPSDRWTAHYLRTNYGEDIRYNHSNKKWHYWDETKWNPDSMDKIRQYAEKNVNKMWDRHREMSHSSIELNTERTNFRKWIVKSESVRGIGDALKYAESLEGIAVEESDFDKNPNLFNCKNGTFNLESDTFYEHRKSDNLSKMSGVEYNADADCKFWLSCLDLWFDGDPDLIRFIQMAVGYSLSGKTDEELFFFAHGSGKNGKSRFLDALEMLFEDYYLMSDVNLVVKEKYQSSTNYDLPHLSGKRFVAVTELDKKHVFDISLLKKITGGEPIRARFIYGDKFGFKPIHTLWLFGNHLPIINDNSDALWRRLKRIPFNVKITSDKQIPQSHIKSKFKNELSGIFNWALDGYRDYLKNGMIIPKSVKQATEEYRSESDIIGTFLEECIDKTEGINTQVKVVWERYKAWCKDGDEHPLKKKIFKKTLKEHGFSEPSRGNQNVLQWKNLGIITENQ